MTVFPQRPFFILYKKVQVKLADIDFSMSAKVGYVPKLSLHIMGFEPGLTSYHADDVLLCNAMSRAKVTEDSIGLTQDNVQNSHSFIIGK